VLRHDVGHCMALRLLLESTRDPRALGPVEERGDVRLIRCQERRQAPLDNQRHGPRLDRIAAYGWVDVHAPSDLGLAVLRARVDQV